MSSVKQLRLTEDGAKKAPSKDANQEEAQQEVAEQEEQVVDEEEPNVMSVAKSIVKVFTQSNEPDHGQPYQLGRSQPSTGSGFFIEYNQQKFIITNAHVVSHFTTVHIKRWGSARKWRANVLFLSDTNDLAVLTVDAKAFWRNVDALQLIEPPQLNSELFVCGYPTGGDELSVTSGVASRYGVQPYAHSADSYLTCQVSAPINPGNSGGPVLQYQKGLGFGVVGVAFQSLTDANNIGYMIPTPVVKNMLEQWRTNNYGCPSLNIVTQSIESQIQRNSLFIPALGSLLDYLYDMSLAPMVALKAAAEAQGVALEDVLAAMQGGAEGEAEGETEGEEKKEGADKKEKSVKAEKEVAATPTDSAEASPAGIDMMEMLQGQGDENPLHFIIGQDDEYDYVCFVPADDGEDEDDEVAPEQDADEDDEGDEDDEDDAVLVPKRSKSGKASPKAASPKSPKAKKSPLDAVDETVEDEDEDEDGETIFELQVGSEETPLYRIKRTSDVRPPPPADLLPLIMSGSDINDTQIGVIIRNIVPHTESAKLLKVGDVILAIDGNPISSDETVLFRANERVRYSYLTTNKQIGTTCSMLILRDFDILTIEVPIQLKASIAPIFFHRKPLFHVALGLLFVPLSGNLLSSEFGEDWTSASPVNLMNALLQGLLQRFHKDEEVVVLTQILPHPVTEGYDQAMERLTHVNGERIINMTHLGTVLNNAVVEYDRKKAELKKLQEALAASPKGDKAMEDDLPDAETDHENPAVFYQDFAQKLKAFAKIKYINFTLESGSNITLSLEDGYKHQVDILKLHQIPFPGCSESLLPMYDMTVDLKFKNPEITEEVVATMLAPPPPKQHKSVQLAQVLSPGPLSPRDSHRVTPLESKIYNPSANANVAKTQDNIKSLSLLESHPELSQKQFANDFSPKSPVEHLKKFKKNQDKKKKAVKKADDETKPE